MILAKPVVANRYWILKRDNRKIGTVEASAEGYNVVIDNTVRRYKTIPMVRRHVDIEFEPAQKPTKVPRDRVHGYDTGCRVYNAMWDVRRRLPLFTKTTKSKSWYAAGWYCVQQHRRWQVVHNPKLIVLDRYLFQGPFHSQQQAQDSLL